MFAPITLSFSDNNKHHLLITNLLGEIFIDETVYGNEITLDVSSLTAGVYLAVIKTDKEILVKKFVKE
jgi:hypothetical protein